MKAPTEKPTVKLVGKDGNAFAIMGRVKNALKRAGADEEYIKKYLDESMAGDYDNLLATATKYAEVE